MTHLRSDAPANEPDSADLPRPAYSPWLRIRDVLLALLITAALVGGIATVLINATRPPAPGLVAGNGYGPAPGYPLPPAGTVAEFRLVGARDVFRLEYDLVNDDDAARLVVAASPATVENVDVGWRPYVEPTDDRTAPVMPERPMAAHAFPAVIEAGGRITVRLTVHKPATCPPMERNSALSPILGATFAWYDGTVLRKDYVGVDGSEPMIATCGG